MVSCVYARHGAAKCVRFSVPHPPKSPDLRPHSPPPQANPLGISGTTTPRHTNGSFGSSRRCRSCDRLRPTPHAIVGGSGGRHRARCTSPTRGRARGRTSRSARSPHCSHGHGSRLAMTCSSNAGRAVHERCVAAQSATRGDSAASRTRRAGAVASRTRSEGEVCSYAARVRGAFARRARREHSKAVPPGARSWSCAMRARGRYIAFALAASPTRFRIAPRLCAADTYAGVSERECKHGLV